MKPIESISNFLRNIQKNLFPNLQEAFGPLTKKQQKLVKILEMIRIKEYIPIYGGFRGHPENDRLNLCHAFVAKAVYNIPRTNQLREQLLANNSLRQICGWDSKFLCLLIYFLWRLVKKLWRFLCHLQAQFFSEPPQFFHEPTVNF